MNQSLQGPPPPKPTVELLYLEGCANTPRTAELAESVVADLGLDIPVRRILVTDGSHAAALGFAGSPTLRVNGEDVEDAGASSGIG